jgi:probable HAF family extracellular repeat protein
MRELAAAIVVAIAIHGCGGGSGTTAAGSAAAPAGPADAGAGAGSSDAGAGPAGSGAGPTGSDGGVASGGGGDAGPAGSGAGPTGSDGGVASGGGGDAGPAGDDGGVASGGGADAGPAGDDGGVASGGGADAGTGGASMPPAYSVTGLGNAFATFIDPHGTIAGSACDSTSCVGATFTTSGGWSPAPVPDGALWVVPAGIDAAGRVAMNAEFPGSMRSTYSLPYLSAPLELVPIVATDAHDLSRGSHLAAVNAAGHLVGSFYENAFGPDTSSGSYFYDGAVTRIAAGPGGNRSAALAINSRDQVVGWMQVGSVQHAYLWDGGTLQDLGTVSGASTMATAINDSGVVTGWGATSPTSGVSVAFRWDGQMHVLGCPAGTIHCETFAIDARGDIVGEALVSITEPAVAFLYRDGVFYRLDDLVQDAPGWRFHSAVSVNDAGQIVGAGTLDGVGQAFLLTPKHQ